MNAPVPNTLRPSLCLDHNGDGYDYDRQAWVIAGRYETCGHPLSMKCDCYGRMHFGERAE